MITVFTGNILRYLEDNDFPVATFIITCFGGNVEALDKTVVDMAKKGIPKEQIISALVVYEQNQLLILTKQFKLNFKQLQTRELENENYKLLVSNLTAFTG